MFTFPRELRLLTPGDFNFVFQQPQRAVSSYFTILARLNTLGHPRVGISVSKKHVKRAHERNRVKRLARENFRLCQHTLPAMDYVILAKKGVDNLDNHTLTTTLDKLWHRHRRLAQNSSLS